MTYRPHRDPGLRRHTALAFLLAGIIYLAPPRNARSGSELDTSMMYYVEDGARMEILSPAFLFTRTISDTLTIKIDGVYNAISGASPTGAPADAPVRTIQSSGSSGTATRETPVQTAPESPTFNDEENDEEHDREGDRRFGSLMAVTGATPTTTPTPTPTPSPAPTGSSSSSGGGASSSSSTATTVPSSGIPVAAVEDTRYATGIDLIKRLGNHSIDTKFSVSEESDYQSIGLALTDAVELNKKNTTVSVGGAYTHDIIDVVWTGGTDTKDTIEGLVGVSQVLSKRSVLTCNLTVGQLDGYLNDQYKVAEVDGAVVPELRPDRKTKTALYLGYLQYLDLVHASLEPSYRYYTDSFGITAHTLGLAWNQELGPVVLTPSFRYYLQSEADFYATRFQGAPVLYSSDYRLSDMTATTYGLKASWNVTPNLALDIAYDRYDQKGNDGVTPSDAYTSANILTGGIKLWF